MSRHGHGVAVAPGACQPDELCDASDLVRLDFFRAFPPHALAALSGVARWRGFEAGQTVLEAGDPARDVCFIAAGEVRIVTSSSGGHEMILDELGPGQSFGEISVVDGGRRAAGVVALTRARICLIGAVPFMAFALSVPQAAHQVMRLLAGLVREKDQRLLEFAALPVRARLISLLLRLARPHPAAGLVVSPPRPHHELAARIGTGREVVSRVLGALQREGLVAPERGGLLLPRPERLIAEIEAGYRIVGPG